MNETLAASPAPMQRPPPRVVVLRTRRQLLDVLWPAFGRRPWAAAPELLQNFTTWAWLLLLTAVALDVLAERRPPAAGDERCRPRAWAALLPPVAVVLAWGGWYLTHVHPRVLILRLPGPDGLGSWTQYELHGEAMRCFDALVHWLPALGWLLVWLVHAGPVRTVGREATVAGAALVLGMLALYRVALDSDAIYRLRPSDVVLLSVGAGVALLTLVVTAGGAR